MWWCLGLDVQRLVDGGHFYLLSLFLPALLLLVLTVPMLQHLHRKFHFMPNNRISEAFNQPLGLICKLHA